MNQPEQPRGMIGIKTAIVLFVLLALAAFATLKGPSLYITLLIVLALAVKAYVHHLRSRIE
jgi:hypothetical protein